MLNKDIAKGKWKQFAGRAKETWGKLTDDEITESEGNAERLAGKVQERYGVTREEARKQVNEFLDRHQ
jgi:uncharacterized protein YjbJ (UPF0337 family)